MKIKFVLPALTEAKSPFWRPIKYALFPPIGLATLAAYCADEDELQLVDEHVEELKLDDEPDLLVIQVYITNARRAYEIADHYRSRGVFVALGGLHVTSLPDEAREHADAVFIGPGEETFPEFLTDLKNGNTKQNYFSSVRTLREKPKLRRDLIKRNKYLVPNSLVISRGCPHHCDFCYKEAFFKGGKSFYVRLIDDILEEIEGLPGRHLYFLDDHLFGNPVFARELFTAMQGMGRLFQGASTIQGVLQGDTLELAAKAGLRSLFVGFETLSERNLGSSNKQHNRISDYERAVQKLHEHQVSINGSFVFGLDDDDISVFDRTVEWAVQSGLVTSTFHIATPYPGTAYYQHLQKQGRIFTSDWDLYDTRHAVFQPMRMSAQQLEEGYRRAYKQFYSWSNIFRSSAAHDDLMLRVRHIAYMGGWKKFEPLWNVLIKAGKLNSMLPLLEQILSRKKHVRTHETQTSLIDA